MTFGLALRKLLYIGDIKMGVLADGLGYDISYLSKWINGSKMPSGKNAEHICRNIAAFFQASCGRKAQAEILAEFNLSAENVLFEKALADKLYDCFLNSKGESAEPGNADVNGKLSCGDFASPDEVTNEIADFYNSSSFLCAEGVMILPPQFLSSDFLIRANELCSQKGARTRLHLHQILDVNDFSSDTDAYVRYILKHLSMRSPIRMDYYAPVSENFSSLRDSAVVLEASFAAYKVTNPLTRSSGLFALTHDGKVAEELFRSAKAFLCEQNRITEYLDLYDDLSYQYAISPLNRYIMPFMGPVRLGGELLDTFLDKYLDVPEMYEHHKRLHTMTQTNGYSVVTYVSTIIDYVKTGRIKLFDGVVTVSEEDRKRHLQYLINEIEDGRFLKMLILGDNNPVLRRKDNSLTIYFNERTSFAVSDGPEARSDMINFEAPQFKQHLMTLYSHIEMLSDNYCKHGKDAIDFLHGSLKLM